MRLAKLSLAAIVALGVSAFADVQNVKFGGDAKLFYATYDNDNDIANADLFNKDSSAGQAALDLWVTADVADGAKAKLAVTMLNTLGLENNLVSYVWDAGLGNQWWVSEAWIAKTLGNTTIKVGRQELDTPMAFTEKWSIAKNTFDAAVVLNNDLPKTTLVAAWVGRGNNAGGIGTTPTPLISAFPPFFAYAGVVNDAIFGLDPFGTFGQNGAYAYGVVTKAIPMTTAQVWFYDVVQVAKAWWLQADIDLKEVAPGLNVGIQFNNIDPDVGSGDSAWALKVGYNMENIKAQISYSKVEDNGYAGNTAGFQSKLYTEAWWNYGYVSMNDVSAWHAEVEYSMDNIADFGVYYTSADAGNVSFAADMREFTLTASKSFGSLDATLAYIYTDADDQNVDPATNKADSYNTVQVYLTYNF